jgi:hypothetical protein
MLLLTRLFHISRQFDANIKKIFPIIQIFRVFSTQISIFAGECGFGNSRSKQK